MSANKRAAVTGTIELDTYRIFADRLDQAFAYALRRADKHAEDPLTDAQRERLLGCVPDLVLTDLCEILKFSGGVGE